MKQVQIVLPLVIVIAVTAALVAWRDNLAIESRIITGDDAVLCVRDIERWPAGAEPSAAQAITLPDDWLRNGVNHTEVHYRYRFEAPRETAGALGVLLPAVNLNAQLYLNGRAIDAIGGMSEPVAHNNFTPLLFQLPAAALRAGSNELRVRVVSFPPGHGFLGEFCLGPHALLEPMHDKLMLQGPDFARVITLLSLVFTAFMGFVWTLRRSETMYGWMAATLFFWSLHSLKYHVSEVPISSLYWAWHLFATSISAGMSSFFLIQKLGETSFGPWNRRALMLWAFMIVLITAFAASGSIVFYTLAQACSTIAVFLVSFAFARSLPLIWRHSTFEAYCLMLSLGIAIVLVAYDNLLVFGFLTRTSGQLAILGVPLLLGVFAYMV
ncbi:MAG: hypothetical protein R3228_12005, partial [Halioglobus sp.]|nr:hypothetical protein [Halioglobus sp.]